MLTTFPTLLSYALFVPFIFRICVALFFIEIAFTLKHKESFTNYLIQNKFHFARIIPWKIQMVSFLCALFLVIGLFTQITSIISIMTLYYVSTVNKNAKIFPQSESTFAYVLLICFSLLFLGAGVFAFDLPL